MRHGCACKRNLTQGHPLMKFKLEGFEQLGKWANGLGKDLDRALLVALNRTAYEIRDAQKVSMQQVFDKPTPYALRGVYVIKAKPGSNPVAEVGVPDNTTQGTPQNRFLAPEVYGGARGMKGHERKLGMFTAPSRMAPRDRYGNVPGSFYVRVLSQLGLRSDPMQNATNSRRSKRKRAAQSFFIAGNVLLSRRGDGPAQPMLFLLKAAPSYQPRLPFAETSQKTFDAEFQTRLLKEIRKARGY